MTYIILSTNTGYGLKYLLKCSLCYIPSAKLSYIPIAQHDVWWSAGVLMSYVLPPYLNEINTFSYDILWLASQLPPDQQEEQQYSAWCCNVRLKDICLL